MYIPVILGTAREGRQSEKVAKFVYQEAVDFGLETEIIDVRDYRLEATDNTGNIPQAKKLAEKISKADGLIIISPEYNHGYPGELKMMLDMLYKEYFFKPMAICGVSSGGLGGARMVEKLRLVGVELHMPQVREAVYFSNVLKLFENNGRITDPAFKDKIKKMLDELSWYAKKLKTSK